MTQTLSWVAKQHVVPISSSVNSPRLGQPGDLGVHGVAGLDLDAEVVDRAALAGVLQQHQLQRRLGDGEVRIAGLHLGGRGVEQLGVERDRLVEVIDVESELHTGHEQPPTLWTYIELSDGAHHATSLIYVNVCGRVGSCPRRCR